MPWTYWSAAEEFPTERLDESVDHVALYAKYRQLAAEQAALRRLAMLVAQGVEPSEVFGAVINEMCQCVSAQAAGLWRYETSGEITLLAARLPFPRAGEVAGGHSNSDRRRHPRSDGATHRRARADGQL